MPTPIPHSTKITIVEHPGGDYVAIYIGDKLELYHHSPGPAGFARLLKYDADLETLDPLFCGDDVEPPDSLKEMREAIRKKKLKELQAERAKLDREIERLQVVGDDGPSFGAT